MIIIYINENTTMCVQSVNDFRIENSRRYKCMSVCVSLKWGGRWFWYAVRVRKHSVVVVGHELRQKCEYQSLRLVIVKCTQTEIPHFQSIIQYSKFLLAAIRSRGQFENISKSKEKAVKTWKKMKQVQSFSKTAYSLSLTSGNFEIFSSISSFPYKSI